MSTEKDHITDLFNEMLKMGLVTTSSHWIQSAVDQRNPKLTLDLVRSYPLVYEVWDRRLAQIRPLN